LSKLSLESPTSLIEGEGRHHREKPTQDANCRPAHLRFLLKFFLFTFTTFLLVRNVVLNSLLAFEDLVVVTLRSLMPLYTDVALELGDDLRVITRLALVDLKGVLAGSE